MLAITKFWTCYLLLYFSQSLPFFACSFYTMGQVTPANGVTMTGASKPQSGAPISSENASQSGKDYDFSSLTQGMFSKHWVSWCWHFSYEYQDSCITGK